MSKNTEVAKQVFADYPKEDKVHFTSDGSAFVNENFARVHGRTLAKTDIETINRADVAEAAAPAQTKQEGTEGITEPKYDKLRVADLQELCAARTLDVTNAKVKSDYIALLEADDKAKADADTTTGK